MLINMHDILKDAQKNQYAVALFNVVTLEMARGVLEAAEELKAPVIMGTAEVLLKYTPLEELADMLLPMAKRATVPVVVHFDHGLTEKRILQAMDLGFSSVMYDCSSCTNEENASLVATLTKIAHARGCTVEAELGHVGAMEADYDLYTDPDQALDFVERTGVDALAVAIGTAHGIYKSAPKLDIARLDRIAAKVDTPLVLHGGSGLTAQNFRDCIRHGISKVNIFTDINQAALRAAHDQYVPERGMSVVVPAVVEAVRMAAMEKMRIFGSENRA